LAVVFWVASGLLIPSGADFIHPIFEIFLKPQNPMCIHAHLTTVEVIPDTVCVHQKSEKII